MPVRLLTSSVLIWPDARTVVQVLPRWAEKVVQQYRDVVRIGYFGSYARGDWGVGSDLDVVIILERSEQPYGMRARDWFTIELPVPADILIYTLEEWQSLRQQRRFFQTLEGELTWLYVRGLNIRASLPTTAGE